MFPLSSWNVFRDVLSGVAIEMRRLAKREYMGIKGFVARHQCLQTVTGSLWQSQSHLAIEIANEQNLLVRRSCLS